jgi:hypothetical protein
MLKLGLYRHSKTGNKYRVIVLAKHSETLEDLVVYEALYDNPKSKIWVRPLAMFTEIVEINGEPKPRFEYLEDQNV